MNVATHFGAHASDGNGAAVNTGGVAPEWLVGHTGSETLP
jgi:hypothetical protein